MKKAITEYDPEAAASWARKAIEEKIDPVEAASALTGAIREGGDVEITAAYPVGVIGDTKANLEAAADG